MNKALYQVVYIVFHPKKYLLDHCFYAHEGNCPLWWATTSLSYRLYLACADRNKAINYVWLLKVAKLIVSTDWSTHMHCIQIFVQAILQDSDLIAWDYSPKVTKTQPVKSWTAFEKKIYTHFQKKKKKKVEILTTPHFDLLLPQLAHKFWSFSFSSLNVLLHHCCQHTFWARSGSHMITCYGETIEQPLWGPMLIRRSDTLISKDMQCIIS